MECRSNLVPSQGASWVPAREDSGHGSKMVAGVDHRRGGLDRRRRHLFRHAGEVQGGPGQAGRRARRQGRSRRGHRRRAVGDVGAAADRPGRAVLQRRRLLPARGPGRGRRPRRSVLPGAGHQRPHQEHGAARPRRRTHRRRLLRQQRAGRKDAPELRREPVGQPDVRADPQPGAGREGRGGVAAGQRRPARNDDRLHHGRRAEAGSRR